jgi:hypothetical protein
LKLLGLCRQSRSKSHVADDKISSATLKMEWETDDSICRLVQELEPDREQELLEPDREQERAPDREQELLEPNREQEQELI